MINMMVNRIIFSTQWKKNKHFSGQIALHPYFAADDCRALFVPVSPVPELSTLLDKRLLLLLLGPQVGWGLHPIQDLRGLHKYLQCRICRMLTVPKVRQAITAGDVYFQIAIEQGHWGFLRLSLHGRLLQVSGLANQHMTGSSDIHPMCGCSLCTHNTARAQDYQLP